LTTFAFTSPHRRPITRPRGEAPTADQAEWNDVSRPPSGGWSKGPSVPAPKRCRRSFRALRSERSADTVLRRPTHHELGPAESAGGRRLLRHGARAARAELTIPHTDETRPTSARAARVDRRRPRQPSGRCCRSIRCVRRDRPGGSASALLMSRISRRRSARRPPASRLGVGEGPGRCSDTARRIDLNHEHGFKRESN
jgi:hypothetical protein